MKSCLGGGLQLSVLDGWWAEAYDGENGWAIDGDVDGDHDAQDHRHSSAMFDLLEQEVLPMFHDRDAHGVPATLGGDDAQKPDDQRPTLFRHPYDARLRRPGVPPQLMAGVTY